MTFNRGGKLIRSRLALSAIVILALSSVGLAQNGQAPARTEAQYAGGFRPDACRYPRAARAAQLSGCCQMDLDIDATGRVLKSDGICSDPIFLQPTQKCLAAQTFIPATKNGQAVRDLQHLEYEWRATTPSKVDHCNKLKTS